MTYTQNDLENMSGFELRNLAAKLLGGTANDYRRDDNGRVYTQGDLVSMLLFAQDGEPEQPKPKKVAALTAVAMPASTLPEYMQPSPVDPTYKCPTPDLWRAWEKLSAGGTIENVALRGASGTGKTTYAEQFAAKFERPYVVVECGMIIEPDQLWGNLQLPGGGRMDFHPSPLLEALERDDRPVILFNELNRFQSAKTQNAVLSLLDHQRKVWVEQLGRNVHVSDGITFFITLNEGFDYSGTDVLDAALRSRLFFNITMDYLKLNDEVAVLMKRTGLENEAARNLCLIAQSLRETAPISLRNLEAAARLILAGVDPREATFTALTSLVDAETLNQVIVGVVNGNRI